MAYKVEISSDVIIDLDEAVEWYEAQVEGLGRIYLRRVEEAIHKLELRPKSYSYYSGSFRRIQLRQFPHLIIYKLQDDRIFVLRILHGKRKPINLK